MLPKSRGFVTLMISMFVEALRKLLLCYNTDVRERLHTLAIFDIYNTFGVNLVFDLLLVNDAVRKVYQFHL